MRNLILIFSILFCMQLNAQDNVNCYELKGKLEKIETFKRDCGNKYPKEIAVVIEITITNPADVQRFGQKLYVAQICPEVPGEGWFDGKEYDIEIRDSQLWQWEISIMNSDLFEKNKDKRIYWLQYVSGKVLKFYSCSPK